MHKNHSKATIIKILKYLKPYSVLAVLSLLFAAVSAILTLYLPILIGRAVDCIVDRDHVDFDGIFEILVTMGIVIALTAFFQWLMNIINNRITYSVVKDIRSRAFENLQRLPLSYLDGQSSGDIISRIVTDVDQFSDGLLMGFTQFFTGVMTIVGTLVFMLRINAAISLVVILITPVSIFVAAFI